jgi:HlyD family secretion protein
MSSSDATAHAKPVGANEVPSLTSHLDRVGDPAVRRVREHNRALARRGRQLLLAALGLVALFGVWLAARPRAVPVDIGQVTRGPLVVAIEESGTTRIKDRYVVSVPVAGSLSRLQLEPGDAVREGDALAEIAPALSPLLDQRTRSEAEGRLGAATSAFGQAETQVARATVAKQLADQELARVRALAASGSVAAQPLEHAEFEGRMREQELASAVFAVKIASEEVRVARATLGKDGGRGSVDRHVVVIAPISGTVLRVFQKSAGVVAAGTQLADIGDPAALEVVVDLLTTDAVHVRPETPVLIQRWGGDRPLSGRVRRVEPSAFTRPSALGIDEQRVNVIIALTEPRENWTLLGDGYRVEARLVLWEAAEVLKAPQGAVFRHGPGWAVFAVEGGTAHLRPVQIGHRGEHEVEVLSGVSSGTAVIVHPGDRVKDGARVEGR